MAPTYQTFADEESLLSQPPKTTWATRKAAVAALVLFAVLGVSTTSRGYSMLDIVSAASGGIDFERTVKTLAPGYDFNLSLDPGCTDTDVHGCSAADLAWGDTVAVSAKLTTPGTPIVSTGAKVGWELTVKAGLFPITIEGECDVCGPPGSTCVVEIPLGLAENPVIPLSECPPPTAIPTLEFATNLTLPRKAPNLGPFKSIKVVEPSTIYLKDGSGATLVELDVELKVD